MTTPDLLERWARWRHYRANGELGYPKKCSVGRLVTGAPRCPLCRGSGEMKYLVPNKPPYWDDCPQCKGAGKIGMDHGPDKAIPSLIRITAPLYTDDPMSERIESIVCQKLNEDQRSVIIWEYSRLGRQTDKAERLGISQGTYSKRLAAATEIISQRLESPPQPGSGSPDRRHVAEPTF